MAPETPHHLMHFRCIWRSPEGILATRILARESYNSAEVSEQQDVAEVSLSKKYDLVVMKKC